MTSPRSKRAAFSELQRRILKLAAASERGWSGGLATLTSAVGETDWHALRHAVQALADSARLKLRQWSAPPGISGGSWRVYQRGDEIGTFLGGLFTLDIEPTGRDWLEAADRSQLEVQGAAGSGPVLGRPAIASDARLPADLRSAARWSETARGVFGVAAAISQLRVNGDILETMEPVAAQARLKSYYQRYVDAQGKSIFDRYTVRHRPGQDYRDYRLERYETRD